MYLIDSSIISKFNYLTRKQGLELYESGAVLSLQATKLSNQWVRIQAKVLDKTTLICSFFIDTNSTIVSHDCSCTNQSYCCHMACIFYFLLQNDIPALPYTYEKNEAKNSFFVSSNYQQDFSQSHNILHTFLQNQTNYYGHMYRRQDRMHLAIAILRSNTKNHIRIRYSYFDEDITHYDQNSQAWIIWIKQHTNQSYINWIETDEIEQVKTLTKKYPSCLEDPKHFSLSKTPFVLRIEKDPYYYRLYLENAETYIITDQGFYTFDEDTLVQKDLTYDHPLFSLFKTLADQPLTIDPKEFSSWKNALLAYEGHLFILSEEGVSTLKSKNHKPLTIYADIHEGKICFEAKQGEKTISLDSKKAKTTYPLFILALVLDDFDCDYHHGIAYINFDQDDILPLLNETLPSLAAEMDIMISKSLKRLMHPIPFHFRLSLQNHNGLLSSQWTSDEFSEAELKEMLSLYQEKQTFYTLSNKKVVRLDDPSFEKLVEFSNENSLDSGLVVSRFLSIHQALSNTSFIDLDLDDSLQDMLSSIKGNIKLFIDPHFNNILRPYQKEGVNWLLALHECRFNGLLADEMGLGKTLQVIALLDSVEVNEKPSIVVCPASLIYNWNDEINRFSKRLHAITITNDYAHREQLYLNAKSNDVLIMSYDTLRNDIETLEKRSFYYTILDEAQYIKTPSTKSAKSVKRLDSMHRLALTGTPIENHVLELWSIFDFLMPGYLYDQNHFDAHFRHPIMLENDSHKINELRNLIAPFLLRRTKDDVLNDLPEKVDHIYRIPFSKEERALYQAMLNEARESLHSNETNHIVILSYLTKLRQICCDARLLYENIQEPSSKVKACIDLIMTLHENNKKILLFSSFTSLLDLIKKELDKQNIQSLHLYGSTPKEKRRQLVNDFQMSDVPVFLISLKAGGTGLNLTAASAVIHIDPWWNQSAQNQATDRAHRIGQNSNVQVYRMIIEHSIEESILDMQERKQATANAILKDNASFEQFNKDQLIRLIQKNTE